MYSQQLATMIRKFHVEIFGVDTAVVIALSEAGNPRYAPVQYIHDKQLFLQHEDPHLVKIIRQIRFPGNYHLIFENGLNKHIEDSLCGRRHIKAGTLILSLAAKTIWERVLGLFHAKHFSSTFDDVLLTPEGMCQCVPSEFEFPFDYSDLAPGKFVLEGISEESTLLEIIEAFYDHERSGFQHEMNLCNGVRKDDEQERRMLEYNIEQAVLSYIVVRCNGEKMLLQFLKNCMNFLNTRILEKT